jgi:hypothetical protein
MKMKLTLTSVLVIIFAITLLPQEKKYFDSPFGGGGGFTPGWIFPNIDPLNDKISPDLTINGLGTPGIDKLAENGLFTSGGAGFIYLGFVPGLRLGGMGFGGGTSGKSAADPEGYIYEAEYSIGGGGLTVEYTLPFFKSFGISLGAILGGGGIQIDLYKNKGDEDWLTLGSTDPNSFHHTLNNNYWFFSPTLNFDFPFYRFLNLRIGGGYHLTIAEDWEIDNERDIRNVPSGLNGRALFLQLGIFAGFFSF